MDFTPVPESSSLASVVRKKTWEADDGTLALFHKKFWGKSMKDEELEWRKSESQSAQIRIHKGELADAEDDIISGCYVLDIGIPEIPISRLWIRADYIRIFDFFQKWFDNYARPMARVPSGVLTGQPGIGKSVWIYYAARRCAAEMKPFIWFYMSEYFLFVEEGVYALPWDWRHDDFRCYVWTLVDSDEIRVGVPPELIPHGTKLFVIFSTTPRAERWEHMNNTTRRIVVIMNPWGREEIKRAAKLSLLSAWNFSEDHVDETFQLLGPVPRLCIDSSPEELVQYRRDVNRALSTVTMETIEKLFQDASALSLDIVSHELCLLSREERDDVLSRAVVAPITPSIQSRLSTRFWNLNREEQIRLYKYFERVPKLRKVAGIFYQAAVQSYLQGDGILMVSPMVTLEETKRKRSKDGPQNQWNSTHIVIHNPVLEALRVKVLARKSFEVKIRSNRTVEYSDNGLQSIEPNVFYVPKMTNQMAFDSFILLDGFLYIFQITVEMHHDINHGLIDVGEKYSHGFPPRDKWRFVFIIPPNMTLTVPRPWKLALRDLSPYSAVVDVDSI